MQRFRGADTLKITGLDYSQQFRLLRKRDVCDLVHEKRALIRKLESPCAVALRVGERAFYMSKQFALKKRFGQPTHVDGDHRSRCAWGERMKRLRDQAFASPVFSRDQHVGIGRRDA